MFLKFKNNKRKSAQLALNILLSLLTINLYANETKPLKKGTIKTTVGLGNIGSAGADPKAIDFCNMAKDLHQWLLRTDVEHPPEVNQVNPQNYLDALLRVCGSLNKTGAKPLVTFVAKETINCDGAEKSGCTGNGFTQVSLFAWNRNDDSDNYAIVFQEMLLQMGITENRYRAGDQIRNHINDINPMNDSYQSQITALIRLQSKIEFILESSINPMIFQDNLVTPKEESLFLRGAKFFLSENTVETTENPTSDEGHFSKIAPVKEFNRLWSKTNPIYYIGFLRKEEDIFDQIYKLNDILDKHSSVIEVSCRNIQVKTITTISINEHRTKGILINDLRLLKKFNNEYLYQLDSLQQSLTLLTVESERMRVHNLIQYHKSFLTKVKIGLYNFKFSKNQLLSDENPSCNEISSNSSQEEVINSAFDFITFDLNHFTDEVFKKLTQ